MTNVGGRLVAVGFGAVLLAGCGGGGGDFAEESAEDIVSQSQKDTKDLKAVRVVGDVSNDGQTIEMDLQLSTSGDCTGSMTLGGGTIELLGVEGTVWMKPDATAWESFAPGSADDVVAAVGDKWVSIPSDDDSLAGLCDLDELLAEMDGDDDDTKYEKSGTEEIEGDEVVVVTGTDDDGTTVASMLTDDPHYLVRLERTEGDDPGTVTFADWDEDVEVEEPAEDEQVDLSSLGG